MVFFLSDGRLGNQLFQYAFLNTIKKDNEKIIAANMTELVDSFDVDNHSFIHLPTGKYLRLIIEQGFKPFFVLLVKMKLVGYIEQCRDEHTCLPAYTEKHGLLPFRLVETNFFQSEIFFRPDKIDFTIKLDALRKAADILTSLSDYSSKVFVHVRRGDYVSEKFLGKKGLDLPKQYFLDAIDKINHEAVNPVYVFVTDDPGFVECCFADVDNKYISDNSVIVDLALMSLCEYGIVSNSSFSWWGAYLMKNRKKVIFPKYWYGWKSKVESHVGIQPDWAEQIEVHFRG